MLRKWTLSVAIAAVSVLVAQSSFAQVPDRFEDRGPFQTMTMQMGQFTIYAPTNNPDPSGIMVFGLGTFTSQASYRALLTHLASHGVFVASPNSASVGNGRQMVAAIDLAVGLNESGMFAGQLNVNRICVGGHSQGGGGALVASRDPRVTCSVPVSLEVNITSSGRGTDIKPATNNFIFVSQNDGIAPPQRNQIREFNRVPSSAPTQLITLAGAGHNEILGNGGGFRGVLTAALLSQLNDDDEARALFFPSPTGSAVARDRSFTVRANFETAPGMPTENNLPAN